MKQEDVKNEKLEQELSDEELDQAAGGHLGGQTPQADRIHQVQMPA